MLQTTTKTRLSPRPANAGEIATPALVVDLSCVERNIERLRAYATDNGLSIRPHTKTHKSKFFAQKQIESGAIGLTVAKSGEAEVMGEVCSDLLLAYPTVDGPRCERIARLSRDLDVKVAIDSVAAAEAIGDSAARFGSRVGVLIDLDVGMKRTGLQTAEQAVALAQHVERQHSLVLNGIFCYPGHVWSPPGEQGAPMERIAASMHRAIDAFDRHGLCRNIVSGGSTPTAFQSHHIPQLTEIRPGTYIFNDMNTVRGGYCTIDDCAARILCCVVSDAVPGQVVIDAGSKTLTTDRCLPAPECGFGFVVEYPSARIVALSEEHGQVDIRDCIERPQLGERLIVIPNHICPCVNLQDVIWLSRSDEHHLEPIPVDARGQVT